MQEIQKEFHQNGKNSDNFEVLNENSNNKLANRSTKRTKLRENRQCTKVELKKKKIKEDEKKFNFNFCF